MNTQHEPSRELTDVAPKAEPLHAENSLSETLNDLSVPERRPPPEPNVKAGKPATKEELHERIDDALVGLEHELRNGSTDQLQTYLRFLSQFHNYSFGNVMLIALQNPDATLVAGYRAWQNMGRQVRKGESGIRILAPMIKKKRKGETDSEDEPQQSESESEKGKSRSVYGFRAVSVFDVSQTDGEDLPQLRRYGGDPAHNTTRLKTFVESLGIELIFEPIAGGALGSSEKGRIRIRPDLPDAETFAVLVHETAHELLHKGERRKETTKTSRETEAEAVAFTVCAAIGLEGRFASADYIRLYQGDADLLRESLDVIRQTASRILAALEKPDKDPE